MKKTQKKLGNKGFSLVELIVVIAIMAVLVGVLAPTLVRNIEKSKESTDMQTLDSIRGSVTTALSVEKVNNALTEAGGTYTDTLSAVKASTTGFAGLLKTELENDGVLNAELKSKAAKKTGTADNVIVINIDDKGKVTVSVKTAKTATDNVNAKNLGQDFIVQ